MPEGIRVKPMAGMRISAAIGTAFLNGWNFSDSMDPKATAMELRPMMMPYIVCENP